MDNYKIYMHINKINHKKYIGQTKQAVAKRWGASGKKYQGQPFYNAIQKYGWENFEHLILVEGLSKEQADLYETELIKMYKTTEKQYGYNIQKGGTAEQHHNGQTISLRNKKMWEDGTFPRIINTPVYCVELNLYFESALAAERYLKLDNSCIQKVCKGINKYAGIYKGQPLHWIYIKDITEQKIKNLKNRKEILKGIGIPILCVELSKTFESAAIAGKELKIDPSCIRKCIKGTSKTAGGYHWKSQEYLLTTISILI